MTEAVGFDLSRQQRDTVRAAGDAAVGTGSRSAGAAPAAGPRRSTVSLTVPLAADDPVGVRERIGAEIARHEVLRTTLLRAAGLRLPVQQVHEDLPFAWQHAAATPVELRAMQVRQVDPTHGPVLAAGIAADGADRYLVLTAAATVADVPTLELVAAAAEGAAGLDDPIQYGDYAAWQLERTQTAGGDAASEATAGTKSEAMDAPDAGQHAASAEQDQDAQQAADVWRRLVRGHPQPTAVPGMTGELEPPLSGPHLTIEARHTDNFASTPAAWFAAWAVAVGRLAGDVDGSGAVTIGVEVDPRRVDAELVGAAGPYTRVVPLTVTVPVEGPFADFADSAGQLLDLATTWFEWAPDLSPGGVLFGVGPMDAVPARDAHQLELRVAPDGRTARVLPGPDGTDGLAVHAARAVQNVLGSASADLRDVDVLGTDAIDDLLGNDPHPAADQPFVARFLAAAARHPDRVAVTDGTVSVRYAELAERVDGLAGRLVAAGAGPAAPVAIHLERSVDFVVALLAAQRAGAGYLPLDVDQPAARTQQQLAAAGTTVAITDGTRALEGVATAVSVTAPGAGSAPDSDATAAAPAALPEPSLDDLAYVIFTSGSTGTPKGVAVPASALANYVAALLGLVGVASDGTPADGATALGTDDGPAGDAEAALSWALMTSPTTDLGNTAIFPALASGGTLHVVPRQTAQDPAAFARYAAQHRIDILKITPSHLGALLVDRGADVLPRHTLIVGGEALPWELVREVQQRGACRVVNHYGPTETTVGALANPLDRVEGAGAPDAAERGPSSAAGTTGSVPIGRPLPGLEALVLDARRRLAPIGAVGELAIGGAGLARGYVNDAAATAERFVDHPYREDRKVYLTGDLARRLPNGTIEFLGRRDGQVKVRGYRVERGEIEAALRAHPSVRRAAVVLRPGRDNGPQLVGYVVCQVNPSPSEQDLHDHLAGLLPDYLVPARLVVLDALPLRPNGKLDEDALPEPPEQGRHEHVRPSGPVEERIAGIFETVLGVEQVGATDDFFALGGHSLLATRIIVEVRSALGVQLPVYSLFEAPTVRGLAVLVDQAQAAESGVSDDELAAMIAELDGMSDEEAAALLAAESEQSDSPGDR